MYLINNVDFYFVAQIICVVSPFLTDNLISLPQNSAKNIGKAHKKGKKIKF